MENLEAVMIDLSNRLVGFECTRRIGAPPETQWTVRGFRDDPNDPHPVNEGQQPEYFGATPSEAVAKALADNPPKDKPEVAGTAPAPAA